MVVIKVLSENVYLFKFNIVLAMNKTLGLILSSAQNFLIICGLIFLEIDFKLPSSGLPFKLGVRTVESTSCVINSWKYLSHAMYSSLFSFSFSINAFI